ncbi:MAG: tetraacyldisaccharide 4'-kinase [Pirellulaceae bacterium]
MDWRALYYEVVSGRRHGLPASVLRGLLRGGEPIYQAVVGSKNRRFDSGQQKPHKVPAPVISVGNLTVGGTGKTPLVCWLAEWFQERGAAVTLISRGYGAQRGRPNDEALELAARLPDVPHVQNPDRVAAARQALAANPRQVLLLDDAFQHRRIARDLDIVLLDALAPFGYERLLPRGLLREPVEGLARAQVVALSRADAVDEATRERVRQRVEQLAPQAAWLELEHRPVGFVNAAGIALPLGELQGKRVAAFCGIGNPAGFRHTLHRYGLDLAGLFELSDHAAYPPAELARIEAWLRGLGDIEAVVCTRKDLVKIPRAELAGRPLWALDIRLEITAGRQRLEALLEPMIAKI